MVSQIKKFCLFHPLLLLSIIYLLTRLINLTLLPVFSDEALYIEWGWRAIHYPGQLFHALHDAKQPLLMWFFGLGETLFPDTLWGSRIISVGTGFLSLLGIYLLAKKIFDQKIAFISGLLYIVIPFFVFFDRQALMESSLVACSVWSLYFLIKLNDQPNLKTALLLGTILGLGFFIKTTAIIFLLAFIIIQTIMAVRHKDTAIRMATLVIFSLLAFCLVTLPLFFQPQYWQTLSTHNRWTFTASQLLKFPISQWLSNIACNNELAFVHLTPPIYLLVLIGLWLMFKSRNSRICLILLWIIIPFIPYLITVKFSNYMIFRYLTPFLPLTTIPAAIAISRQPKWLLPLIIFPAAFSLLLIFNPIGFFNFQNKITRYSYIEGYITGFDTGYEVNEIVKYFKNISVESPIYLTIGVHSFNPESGIWNNFRKNPNVTVSYFDSLLFNPSILPQIDCLTADRPLYFVAKLNDTVGLEKYFQPVTVITNSQNKDYVTVYTLKKDCQGKTLNLSLSNPINH